MLYYILLDIKKSTFFFLKNFPKIKQGHKLIEYDVSILKFRAKIYKLKIKILVYILGQK